MHAQVLRCLPVGYASILDQAHSLKLELPRKLPSLHGPPPAPSKHLTRCLRNRVQATAADRVCRSRLPAAKLDGEAMLMTTSGQEHTKSLNRLRPYASKRPGSYRLQSTEALRDTMYGPVQTDGRCPY